ncbi:hypothetical protein OH77DRAFT_625677 [Trametes cingulata]|nr:hypothetical protein OH77DRAFT_625677 [Trametes cingulata]
MWWRCVDRQGLRPFDPLIRSPNLIRRAVPALLMPFPPAKETKIREASPSAGGFLLSYPRTSHSPRTPTQTCATNLSHLSVLSTDEACSLQRSNTPLRQGCAIVGRGFLSASNGTTASLLSAGQTLAASRSDLENSVSATLLLAVWIAGVPFSFLRGYCSMPAPS